MDGKVEDIYIDHRQVHLAKKKYRKHNNDCLEFSEDGGSISSDSSDDLPIKQRLHVD